MYMLCKAWLARNTFSKPGKDMVYLWITGTDGKSTTCGCLYQILKSANHKVWIISTVFIDVWDWLVNNETHMTSLDHKVFWNFIQQAEKNGITHMIVESSSHAMYQYRSWPIRFAGVGITNLTREHLDFHRTMDHYARSKAELFERLLPSGTGIRPIDFEYASQFWNQSSKTFWYDERADIFVTNITQDPELSFDLHMWDKQTHIDSQLLWVFNCDNIMIATYISHTQWLSLDQIKYWVEQYSGLPGRQEIITTQEWISAMIDFALTPDALATLYTATRDMWYIRLIAVFGATGNRDQGKRPKMAAVATELCDHVILTEDENYHEDGLQIIRQMEEWIDPSNVQKYETVQDRTQAIRRWLELAKLWDIVIVTGMANYTSRAMNEGDIPRNEREVIESQIRELWYTLNEVDS